jgi:hypothetical protein
MDFKKRFRWIRWLGDYSDWVIFKHSLIFLKS